MPDHVHEIVKGQTLDADVEQYIRKAKQYSGYHFQQAFEKRLWVRNGFDQLLQNDSELQAALRYVLENPLKAGLAARAIDYPFTGSATYTMQELMDMAYS